ncbi:MAG: hypothetical protein PVH38_10080, partial [Gammaproteobacteria bacterium]
NQKAAAQVGQRHLFREVEIRVQQDGAHDCHNAEIGQDISGQEQNVGEQRVEAGPVRAGCGLVSGAMDSRNG